MVEANRALLTALVATNFFGQNTPAIAATEALYAEMWAQDATAMYGYAGSALPAAAALTPFNTPPQTTNPSGQSAQHAAAAQTVGTTTAGKTQTLAQAMSTVPSHAQSVSTGSSSAHATTSSGSSSAHATTSSGSSSAHSAGSSGTSASGTSASTSGASTSGASTSTSGASTTSTSSQYYYIKNFQDFRHVYDPYNEAINKNFYNYGVTFGDQADFNATNPKVIQHLQLPRLPPLLYSPETANLAGGSGTVLASTGKAASVGTLSVPPSWSPASPAAGQTLVAATDVTQTPPPETTHRGVLVNSAKPAMDQLPPSLGPMGGPGPQHTGNAVFRMRDRRFRMPRPAVGG